MKKEHSSIMYPTTLAIIASIVTFLLTRSYYERKIGDGGILKPGDTLELIYDIERDHPGPCPPDTCPHAAIIPKNLQMYMSEDMEPGSTIIFRDKSVYICPIQINEIIKDKSQFIIK